MGECYIQMGSIHEALQHLTPDIVTDLEISRVPLGKRREGYGNLDDLLFSLVNPEFERVEPPAPRPKCKPCLIHIHVVPHLNLASGVSGFPENITVAKATLLLNLCSVYCMQKDYELAKKALHQVDQNFNNIVIVTINRLLHYLVQLNCLDKPFFYLLMLR